MDFDLVTVCPARSVHVALISFTAPYLTSLLIWNPLCVTCSGFDSTVTLTANHAPHISTVLARHQDRVIQARWHPSELQFATSSADQTARVWSLSP